MSHKALEVLFMYSSVDTEVQSGEIVAKLPLSI